MHVAVTAVGADRPGIVAAVSRVLYEHGANVEDSRMAILGGHFAMVLVVALGSSSSAEALEAALAEPAAALDLVVSVRPLAAAAAEQREGAPFVITVYGADRPGIVARVSAALAERRVNISDLATHVAGDDPPVYVMILEVTLPSAADPDEVAAHLRTIAGELGVDVSMRAAEPETF